jgi:hypothetical protein
MKITREYIESLKAGKELDGLVGEFVFNEDETIHNYSTNITYAKRIIDKYNDVLINFLSPNSSWSYGWHCNIKGIHSRACDTIEEAICQAGILYSNDELWTESEKWQNEIHENKQLSPEDIERIRNTIKTLEDERLYTRKEIKKLLRS